MGIVVNRRKEALQEVIKTFPDWKPIRTVPKNGKPVLVFLEEKMLESQQHVATFHKNITIIGGHFSHDAPKPTHWMELPGDPE